MLVPWLSVFAALPSFVLRADTTVDEFATTPGKLRVTENSGVCETTPNVYQASGYGDLTSSESIWFWYFDSRKDAANAPLVLWFNGGPGSSSMIGLLQEHGPCRITNNSQSVTLNPYSWNNEANVLYIDQPVGVGFSHGTLNVGTSEQAASDIWNFLQIFLADSRFSHLAQNELALWTEYGGHYGPVFAQYFLTQNAAIASGSATGVNLNLKTLGIGNGLTDPITQYPGYISYAQSNPYVSPLAPDASMEAATILWSATGGCQDQIVSWNNNGTDAVCSKAQSFCNGNIISRLIGDHDEYYVLSGSDDLYPPDINSWLSSVQTQIGAEVTREMTNGDVYDNFALTGDWMRSKLPALDAVVDAGVRVMIYNGDADFIVNYQGIENMFPAMANKHAAPFNSQPLSNYTVKGQPAGLYKTCDLLSYVRVFGAGHEVPAYGGPGLDVGEVAFQLFDQTMKGRVAST
ncbi:Alpha/Beta hydrolase protein [Roridomyces roridus]|uniref:Alpha/Beta hydrolase protein n=1 Tax=Roridomyces roridus TaxID=1738132 RepID=A0AAD7C064_9AGAR|nr:Alpha/Beta hydrolase protein [Roridomyces roridus]